MRKHKRGKTFLLINYKPLNFITMKTILFTIFVLLTINLSQAQFVKNLGEYETESGFTIKKGTEIKILCSTINEKGQTLWTYYGRKKIPAPTGFFKTEHIGKTFTVEKVVKLKGLKDDLSSILVVFFDGKKKCYCHIIKAMDSKEVEVI